MLFAKILIILSLTRRAIPMRGVRKTCTLNIMPDFIVKGVDWVWRGPSFRLDAPGDVASERLWMAGPMPVSAEGLLI